MKKEEKYTTDEGDHFRMGEVHLNKLTIMADTGFIVLSCQDEVNQFIALLEEKSKEIFSK